MSEIIDKLNGKYNEKMLKKCLYNSLGLSSDVDVALDPNYKNVFDDIANFIERGKIIEEFRPE